MSFVITIGRKYGSGGHIIGQKVAERLGVPYYDKNLAEMAAAKSKMSPEAAEEIDEKATNSFLYSIVTGSYESRAMTSGLYYDIPINDKLFIAQSEIIKEVAHNDCVIVGRCADYVLAGEENVKLLRIFFYASDEYCVNRITEVDGLPRQKAKELTRKINKRRRTYYEYYTNNDWGGSESCDLCINSETVGFDAAVDAVCKIAETLGKR